VRERRFNFYKEALGFRPGPVPERDTSACIRRHQAFSVAPVPERDASACIRRHQEVSGYIRL